MALYIFAIAGLLLPAPVLAQGTFAKDRLRDLIQRSGIFLSTGARAAIDDDVGMGPSVGIGLGIAAEPRTGWTLPLSYSRYHGDLETAGGAAFGRFRVQQIMSGVGYQWARGRMVYGVELGVGYSFNRVRVHDAAPAALNADGPVRVSLDDSPMVKPQVRAEYFVRPKVSLRAAAGYVLSNAGAVVDAATGRQLREWRPHHLHLSVGVGFFPFRK